VMRVSLQSLYWQLGNQYQRKSNARQVRQKMEARLRKGYWPFGYPLGLINKKDSLHGKILTPHEPYASVLKKAIERYRDGALLTQQEVRHCLHEEFKAIGLSNRPALSTTQEILENPYMQDILNIETGKIPFMKAQHDGLYLLRPLTLFRSDYRGVQSHGKEGIIG